MIAQSVKLLYLRQKTVLKIALLTQDILNENVLICSNISYYYILAQILLLLKHAKRK